MDLSQTPRFYIPSTELQRRAVEAKRNQQRLQRYKNIWLYQFAQRAVQLLNGAR